jgi:RimJ/RimL family protein N-acetyltransferase
VAGLAGPEFTFTRLTEVDLDSLTGLLNEPRNARHMPLAGTFTTEQTAEWVAAKDAQWEANGYGPWAILVDGSLAGWGGFQDEGHGADFGLVLSPRWWGQGEEIARQLLTRGFVELGLAQVLIALPYSRNPDRVVARLGFVPDGEVTYGTVAFRQYRLTRAAWTKL